MKSLLVLALVFAFPARTQAAASLTVRSVQGGLAKVSGEANGLQKGSLLYFARSPFKFPVREVNGKEATVEIPAGYELKIGDTLLREPSDTIRKNMQTEEKLKRAIED